MTTTIRPAGPPVGRPSHAALTGLTAIQVSFALPLLRPEQRDPLAERQIKASEDEVQFGG